MDARRREVRSSAVCDDASPSSKQIVTADTTTHRGFNLTHPSRKKESAHCTVIWRSGDCRSGDRVIGDTRNSCPPAGSPRFPVSSVSPVVVFLCVLFGSSSCSLRLKSFFFLLGTCDSHLSNHEIEIPDAAPFLFSSKISTLEELGARTEKIDLRFHECAKKRENRGDFAGLSERIAQKCSSGL